MKHLTALTLMLAMNTATAGPLTHSWTLQMFMEDGTPIDISEIEGTNVYMKWEGGIEAGPFMFPLPLTHIDFTSTSVGFCIRVATLLHNGDESKKTGWECSTNTLGE